MARALRVAAACPVLLLPRIATLAQWATQVPLDQPISPRAAREALLYRALSGHASLASADLWAVAAELATLFDELTRYSVRLPATPREFARQLEAAYRSRANKSFEFEARLVHELWHLTVNDRRELDAEAAYQMRLARIAAKAEAPLYVVGLRNLAPAEQQFLERYSERTPVQIIDADAGGAAFAQMLAAAWPNGSEFPDLLQRAEALKAAQPASVHVDRLEIFGAASVEQEARAIDAQVRAWLLEGHERIAVVALDRVSARRARALLERAQVLVRDESGWPLATTSAATAIGRWLDVAVGDADYRDLLDLMKSPFAFHDWPRELRQQVVQRLERAIREAGVLGGFANFIALAEERGDAEARQLLVSLQRGVNTLGRGRRTLARWLAALVESLMEIGVHGGLIVDNAGLQLIDYINKLQVELAGDSHAVSFAEWRRWLSRQLEAASYRDASIDSPVVFTHLTATPLRTFDGVIVVGCDAAHLPGPDGVGVFFNQDVRAQLGLPTREASVRETASLLADLMLASGKLLLTWQRTVNGEENLLSPQIERLLALHERAYGVGLESSRITTLINGARVRAAGVDIPVVPTTTPAPAADAVLLPRAISASGYNTLLACPYRYHARYLLRLAEADEVRDMIEKADHGSLVHHVLHQFHTRHPRVAELAPEAAQADLEQLSEAAFAIAIRRNHLARAWLLRWNRLIPQYLDWQRAREAEGWHWHAGEVDKDITMTTSAGHTLILRGRIDRVDINADGAAALVDYKTQSMQTLGRKLGAPGEDVQLPVYALLWGGSVAAALFLSIDRDEVDTAEIEDELAALAQATRERLGKLYDAMAAGHGLPAQGAASVCEYCEVHGLCRRLYWS